MNKIRLQNNQTATLDAYDTNGNSVPITNVRIARTKGNVFTIEADVDLEFGAVGIRQKVDFLKTVRSRLKPLKRKKKQAKRK